MFSTTLSTIASAQDPMIGSVTSISVPILQETALSTIIGAIPQISPLVLLSPLVSLASFVFMLPSTREFTASGSIGLQGTQNAYATQGLGPASKRYQNRKLPVPFGT
ncbi:hypothetical protein PUNSTDRAFT_134937 [Punctularia strigosozonata HHB-11173 SS5]|uniref:uncharacterized protein n=1 Tax=Punctularia strigosozonata (strain HHB-11173) TaxID=741275 RepID=UPI000441712C|nr:uncharacterized protein PUNSTDRAFT_134552 [Punctularia strigosozonata HHB-11173 SS5]XP_007384514.1 uncharacterized protein PUNSTDRAFT_134937 [Punctularia strigosozonata HHB-11173 SS5]EIN08155.1 hypothetical protein PUNSTDRAFT_134552 [Punctularia strigosozonata HHB-11173 SS5]EIN08562.1 hypothetical protein PUNSTDRAFT_134937 [Punctularia strigosozonata HHB-11173 SS5]